VIQFKVFMSIVNSHLVSKHWLSSYCY